MRLYERAAFASGTLPCASVSRASWTRSGIESRVELHQSCEVLSVRWSQNSASADSWFPGSASSRFFHSLSGFRLGLTNRWL
jgi:hypothetical protein